MRSALLLLAISIAIAGCGRSGDGSGVIGAPGPTGSAAGFESFATANTTRINGANPVENAAAAARAAFPRGDAKVVVLVDSADWQAALAAAVLIAAPLRAPTLLTVDGEMPQATSEALRFLSPKGSSRANGAQVIRIGRAARPSGLKTIDLRPKDAFAQARAIDSLQAGAARQLSDHVIVASVDEPGWAMPAASLAARTGAPLLYVHRDSIPAATAEALDAHGQPRILLMGNESVISGPVETRLAELGAVVRVGVSDPQRAAVAIARFVEPGFGWGIVDPGHGLVFARSDQPLDAVAAAPLAVTGAHGPLLLVDDRDRLPQTVIRFLDSIRPGYRRDPVRAVYNHGWLIGDSQALSVQLQSRIDGLLEIRRIESGPDSQR